ncbi:hypothetical protein AB0N38_11630 [Micromonospora aurantiaca]|uniref:hypothetical protein n=1 Tax=Micromonospora aurantiaca (nom. illeg.) TaxID=47850 RepID=UPI0034257EC0
MSTCPHCGKDTTTEPIAPAGSLARGEQLFRQRRQGVRIERGADLPPDVTPQRPDAA